VDYVRGRFRERAGARPAAVLENALGEWALRFLILGLAVTPLMRFARINLVKYRRAIGLTPFLYVVLHLAGLSGARPAVRLGRDRQGHPQAALYYHRHGGFRCCWCRWR
jgi:hypothetical protein